MAADTDPHRERLLDQHVLGLDGIAVQVGVRARVDRPVQARYTYGARSWLDARVRRRCGVLVG